MFPVSAFTIRKEVSIYSEHSSQLVQTWTCLLLSVLWSQQVFFFSPPCQLLHPDSGARVWRKKDSYSSLGAEPHPSWLVPLSVEMGMWYSKAVMAWEVLTRMLSINWKDIWFGHNWDLLCTRRMDLQNTRCIVAIPELVREQKFPSNVGNIRKAVKQNEMEIPPCPRRLLHLHTGWLINGYCSTCLQKTWLNKLPQMKISQVSNIANSPDTSLEPHPSPHVSTTLRSNPLSSLFYSQNIPHMGDYMCLA